MLHVCMLYLYYVISFKDQAQGYSGQGRLPETGETQEKPKKLAQPELMNELTGECIVNAYGQEV